MIDKDLTKDEVQIQNYKTMLNNIKMMLEQEIEFCKKLKMMAGKTSHK